MSLENGSHLNSKLWSSKLYPLKIGLKLSLGGDTCQQLIGQKNNEIKNNWNQITSYYLYYIILYIINIIILKMFSKFFGPICNNNK